MKAPDVTSPEESSTSPMSSSTRREALAQLAGFAGLMRLGMAAGSATLIGATSARAAPTELRIGYQKSSVNLMVARERRMLEAHLPGASTKWVEFPAGPQILEALAVDSLDVGFTGDTPPVFAQAAGKDIWYAGLEPPKPASSAILVPSGSSIATLAGLKGRRIGFQRGSSAHYLIVKAVEKAGLAWSDITPVYLTPSDARAAFERGALDAWGIWDPYYAAAEIDGSARVLSTGQGLTSNNSYYLVSRALTRQPVVIKALFDALSEADAWVKANRTETAHFLATASGLPLATTIRFLERRTAGPITRLGAADIADQQRVADTFARLGLIPKPVRVADAVASARVSTV